LKKKEITFLGLKGEASAANDPGRRKARGTICELRWGGGSRVRRMLDEHRKA